MSKTVIRLITLVLAVAMVASMAVGCDGPQGASGNKNSGELSGLQADVNPADYEGTTVTFVTWKDPATQEDGPVVEAFQEEYGIKVAIQMTDQMEYVSQISASIASDKQGDIFFENDTFPASLSVMQPLDAMKLDLESDFWNKAVIEASKFEGKPYLVDAVNNVWTEVDLCVYNKNLLESNNIRTPKEYYEAGKWTFENFKKVAEEVTALGKGYVGATSHGGILMAAGGNTAFVFDGQKFSSNINNDLIEVATFLAQMNQDGTLKFDATSFQDGKVGMAITNAYALKKAGYFSKINPDHMGFTYLPKWTEDSEQISTGIYRGWGLIKGAKNPVAAGIFLREYLDAGNYDTADTFHSEEASEFFYELTGNYAEQEIVYYHESAMHVAYAGDRYDMMWMKTKPTQMRTYFDGQANVISRMVDDANATLDTERKWLKDNGFIQ